MGEEKGTESHSGVGRGGREEKGYQRVGRERQGGERPEVKRVCGVKWRTAEGWSRMERGGVEEREGICGRGSNKVGERVVWRGPAIGAWKLHHLLVRAVAAPRQTHWKTKTHKCHCIMSL